MGDVIHAFPSVGVVAKEILDSAHKSKGIIAIVMSNDENPSFTTYALNIPSDTAVFMLLKMINSILYSAHEVTSPEKAH